MVNAVVIAGEQSSISERQYTIGPHQYELVSKMNDFAINRVTDLEYMYSFASWALRQSDF